MGSHQRVVDLPARDPGVGAAVHRAAGTAALAIFLAIYFLSGFSALLYQVVWHRMLAIFSGSDLYATTTIVAAFMAGLGAGSLIGGLLADRVSFRWQIALFALVELAIGGFALISTWWYYDVLYVRYAALAGSPDRGAEDEVRDVVGASFAREVAVAVLPVQGEEGDIDERDQAGEDEPGVAAAAVARTAVVHMLWGTFLVTPYAASGELAPLATTLHDAFIRFTGLLVDREHGLLAYAPVYLLAAAGGFVLRRARTNLWTDVGLVLAAYLIPVLLPQTNLHGWRGEWSPAARFLVPVVPLLCLAAYAYVLVGSRRVVLTLVATQVAMSAYVWQYPKTLWNEGDGHAAFAAAQWLPTWAAPSFIQVVLFAAALYGCVVFGHHCARAAGMSPAAAGARTPTAPT